MKVLLAEDDLDLVDLMTYAMRREGYTVVAAVDGAQAVSRWETERPDIVLLDANLPKLNGFEVCRRIRQGGDTPIIMVTARNDEDDVIRGLHVGADDYVFKPFSAKQLCARMRALLRRAQSDRYREPASVLQVGGLVLDMQSHEVTKDGQSTPLTPLEFRILYLLAMNEGRIIPYSRLVEYAWGYDGGDASLLKTHICHLRRKLSLPPHQPGGIRAVAGVGYGLTRGSAGPILASHER